LELLRHAPELLGARERSARRGALGVGPCFELMLTEGEGLREGRQLGVLRLLQHVDHRCRAHAGALRGRSIREPKAHFARKTSVVQVVTMGILVVTMARCAQRAIVARRDDGRVRAPSSRDGLGRHREIRLNPLGLDRAAHA
jgi:hypothetical protein